MKQGTSKSGGRERQTTAKPVKYRLGRFEGLGIYKADECGCEKMTVAGLLCLSQDDDRVGMIGGLRQDRIRCWGRW